MVDTAALGAVVVRHVGSSPTWGTIIFLSFRIILYLCIVIEDNDLDTIDYNKREGATI